ncbi:hypothetical protein LLS1_04820 [Leifsonia sp. LS1]|uniref:beta-ketoacyl-[acyl-carrier-protein] synthase family protein n=1 Tax=Leifsonia sp. LS1 TaxID=2828483 RepID=UPI001CFD0E69|nr:beta-ketoacyl-[acyl-carrier-protein] synthase family protein [Leifsonia sp. LS1]GIT78813.1 hypothetical protein LLS1_04820 [Leifsonia sp. LS1]
MEDIVITGLGLLTAIGVTPAENWESIAAGRSGIRRASIVPVEGLISDRAGELVDGLSWTPRVRPPRAKAVDRCHDIVADAVAQATEAAGLAASGYAAERIGVSLGTSLGGARSGEEFQRQWLRRGLRSANASLLRHYTLHSVSDYIAETFGFAGPRGVQSNACAAGAVAIAYGVELIRGGTAEVVIAGGVDPLAYFSFGGFSCLGALDAEACAPYTRSSGLNLGEGAGIVVLERRSVAEERAATILGVVGGYGLSADAYHPTAPDPTGRGATRAMVAALEMDGRSPAEVDYINGHGTGTPANDSVEPKAISHLREGVAPPISSTKSMIGHTLGAAGAVEAVVTVMALQKQMLPPTAVPEGTPIDERFGLDIVPGRARPVDLKVALSNSFAFGGNNAALLLRTPDERGRAVAPAERPVVITAVAAIAGSAADSAAVEECLRTSTAAYGEQRVEVEGYGEFPVADVPNAVLKRGINPQHLRRIDAFGRRAAVAAADALRNRGLTREEAAGTGLIFATGTGPIATVEAFQRELLTAGSGNTRLFPNTVMNAAAGHVAILNRLQGPTATLCAGGTSGITALHFATRLIENGSCDRVLVVSADEAPSAMLAGYARIPGYLSRDRSLPFEASGKVFGGAGVAILLEAADVVPRAPVLGRIEGFGLTGDASGVGRLDTSGDGWARSFELAAE